MSLDLTSPFKPDVFRVSAVVLLPGFIASFPWLYWFLWPELQKVGIWKSIPIPLAILLIVLSFGVGLLLEDIGSRIEADQMDRRAAVSLGISAEEFMLQWEQYLCSRSSHELVAHKYLSSFITRFKFELSMIPAVGFAALAVLLAAVKGIGFDLKASLGLLIFSAALLVFLIDEAKKAAVQLHRIRTLICSHGTD